MFHERNNLSKRSKKKKKKLKEISVLEAWNDGGNGKKRPEVDFRAASKKAVHWLDGGASEGDGSCFKELTVAAGDGGRRAGEDKP